MMFPIYWQIIAAQQWKSIEKKLKKEIKNFKQKYKNFSGSGFINVIIFCHVIHLNLFGFWTMVHMKQDI